MIFRSTWIKYRWSVGVVSLLATSGAITWWLLARGTRGAEIANILALPVALVGMAVAVVAVVRPSGTIGAVTSNGGTALPQPDPNLPESAWLVVDDVIVSKGIGHLLFDVRLRNAGPGAVNVTRLNLNILERVAYASVYRPSAEYDIVVHDRDNEIPIAHILQAGEVDRITLRVSFTRSNSGCGFVGRLILLFNGVHAAVSAPFRFASAG